ncbi:hypothetical protein AAFF_G00028340 [Aldrovandia affinis]|uniref:DDE Tnp4 domain-containing protein n=1 Tax=Aldrovandia affinis TaxID=143900 RepID=A0AAD7WG63_9TELE|nr:hypothetical protein AAFF_G00028340 [Aldrovandia affinis]
MVELEVVAFACFLYYFWWNAARMQQQEIQRRKSSTGSRNRRMKLQADRHLRDMTQIAEILRCAQRRRQRIVHHYLTTRRTRSVWAHTRSNDWWERVALHFTDEEWLQEFRLSRETFYFICNKLKSALERKDTAFRLCIPLNKKVAIALWKLATTSDYRTVGDLFGVSVTSVCRCVHEFCKAAIQVLLPELIVVPDEEKLSEMAACYERQWGVPQCVGAIGVSHIPIIRPSKFQADYHNLSRWHSTLLQVVVDGKGMIFGMCVLGSLEVQTMQVHSYSLTCGHWQTVGIFFQAGQGAYVDVT